MLDNILYYLFSFCLQNVSFLFFIERRGAVLLPIYLAEKIYCVQTLSVKTCLLLRRYSVFHSRATF